MAMRLLVLGSSGQVASELKKIASSLDLEARLIGREEVDLTQADAGEILDAAQPDIVINAAAYTAVDRAEDDVEAAFALNGELPGYFASACAARGLPFVHISTDYVFDGSKSEPYVETDEIKPLGIYGLSKAAGEAKVAATGARWAIIRTAWVYSAFGSNFVKTMLRLAADRSEVNVVADQRGSPTWAEDIARAAVFLAQELRCGNAQANGVFHVAGQGAASWADFATAIFEESAARGGPSAIVRPITTLEYPTRARRPANSRLACDKFAAVSGHRAAPWREQLSRCFQELPLSQVRR